MTSTPPCERPATSRLAAAAARPSPAPEATSKALCALLLASAALVGCQNMPQAQQQSPAVAGAMAGPSGPAPCKPLGGPPPARTSNTQNAVIGGVIGAVGGAAIGSSVADRGSVGARNGALFGAMAGALAGSQYNKMIGLSQQPDGSVKLNVPGSVLFRSGSAEVNPAFQQTLGQVASTINEYCGLTARVVGHTDSVGSPASNKLLSERRAEAVATHLRTLNVDPSRLSSEGFGATTPVASNGDEAGRAQNRRVEIFVRPPAN
jgi:outer membrane protein OmpA-like peptidoglycan-associated protein